MHFPVAMYRYQAPRSKFSWKTISSALSAGTLATTILAAILACLYVCISMSLRFFPGFVMAARRCFTLVLHHLSKMGRISCKTESQSEVLGSLVEESVKICRRVTLMALFIFKKETGEKGLHLQICSSIL